MLMQRTYPKVLILVLGKDQEAFFLLIHVETHGKKNSMVLPSYKVN